MVRFRKVVLGWAWCLWATLLACLVVPGQVLAIQLERPIDCQPGVDCFIQNYVDMDPGPGYADDFCGPLSYDKHKGIDFRVPYTMMQEGVTVEAAAPGVVRGIRDGMADVSIRQIDPATVKNRECGNGVLLVHADGTQTQYCHMRKGSIRVKPGDHVTTGQPLGLVGLSGQTEFPHLHFEVRVNGQSVSPFSGKAMESGCDSSGKKPLWTDHALESMPYVTAGGLDVGFNAAPPDINTVFVGGKKQETFTSQSPQLCFWAGFWGVRKGDAITMRIDTPTGEIWTVPDYVVDHNQAQILLTMGKKRTIPWPPGTYKGKAVLVRQGVNNDKSIVIPLVSSITISAMDPPPAASVPSVPAP